MRPRDPLPHRSEPPTVPIPPVLNPGSPFTRGELRSMELDGLLRRFVCESYVPAAADPVSAELRAEALGCGIGIRLRNRLIAGRLTAAWVFGCAPLPEPVELLAERSRRVRTSRPRPGILVHETTFGSFDILELGGMRVSSVLRTAVDLAVHYEPELSLPPLRRMLARPGLGLGPQLLLRGLEALPHRPNKQRARTTLRRLVEETSPAEPV